MLRDQVHGLTGTCGLENYRSTFKLFENATHGVADECVIINHQEFHLRRLQCKARDLEGRIVSSRRQISSAPLSMSITGPALAIEVPCHNVAIPACFFSKGLGDIRLGGRATKPNIKML